MNLTGYLNYFKGEPYFVFMDVTKAFQISCGDVFFRDGEIYQVEYSNGIWNMGGERMKQGDPLVLIK